MKRTPAPVVVAALTMACSHAAGRAGVPASADGASPNVPTPACDSGPCVEPPSCAVSAKGTTDCGASHESCCVSPEVPGGTYDRTYDPVEDGGPLVATDGGPTGEADPASVSGFRLDKYLVTVGRFRQYVNYVTGPTGGPPPAGSGVHTHLNEGRGLANSGAPGTFETGWNADWNEEIATGPGAANAWNDNLTSCLAFSTWTPTAGSQENLPMNCANWYEAYAFCIWDGGFFPSEAEWEYAAAGGSEERAYPWGSTEPGMINQYAIYNCNYGGTGGNCASIASMAPVGTAALGAGRWGQLDLAGEVFEWNLDWYASYVDPCVDCAYLTTASDRAMRGGNYAGNAVNLAASDRSFYDDPTDSDNVIGFRCARAP
jgi:formylglycine-generating enzyme required for sulfatase activity